MGKSIVPEVNANFHRISGRDLFKGEDKRFEEYRHDWKKWPENFHVGKFPLFVDIEATSMCNLKCPFCATTFRSDKIKKGLMSFETLKKIIDEGAANGLYGVKFNIRGEPLLHPDIQEFVRYAKDKGLIDVYFNTNAMLLDEEMAIKLIDSRLDRISISFEGYTKTTYEKYRIGADFIKVLHNVEYLQKLKERLGVAYPEVRIQAVVLPDTEFDLEKYKEFWSGKADEVAFLDYKEMKLKKRGVEYPWACPQIWQRMAVWWDGTILPCNHDDDGTLGLGNVNKMSISKAWHSSKLNRLRELHKKGLPHKMGACDGCYLRSSEIEKIKSGKKKEQP